MRNYENTIRHSDKRYIRNRIHALSSERLMFLGGERLGNLSPAEESPATFRKVRRIMEKRVCQEFWKNASARKKAGARPRYEMRHQVSNSMRNIYGDAPEVLRAIA